MLTRTVGVALPPGGRRRAHRGRRGRPAIRDDYDFIVDGLSTAPQRRSLRDAVRYYFDYAADEDWLGTPVVPTSIAPSVGDRS